MNQGPSDSEADDIPMSHHAYPLKYTYLFDPLKISAQNLVIITARVYRGQVQYQQYYCVKINLCERCVYLQRIIINLSGIWALLCSAQFFICSNVPHRHCVIKTVHYILINCFCQNDNIKNSIIFFQLVPLSYFSIHFFA